mgnify:FL=1
MKKIAILTFHRALNYGALLQAFALQQSLNESGTEIEAEILDYRNDVLEKMYYYPSLRERHDIKSIAKYFLQGRNELRRRERFERFRLSNLPISSKVYTTSNVRDANQEYDAFIVGSDQVWNYKAHSFDENYFLGFVEDNTKKKSYAASFGISALPDDQIPRYRALLQSFGLCSVREEQGIEILRQLGINLARIDIDPSFLLDKQDWIRHFSIRKSKEKYIFAYYFELTPTMKKFVEELSKKTGYYVKYLGNALHSPFDCPCKADKTAGPIEFIDAIYNASYIVTNSFHGTAFAINFNIPFFVELLKSDAKVNSRIENILSATDLVQRQIVNYCNIEDAMSHDIDWDAVNKRVFDMRTYSMDYIKELVKLWK